jgi:hypothetical protein
VVQVSRDLDKLLQGQCVTKVVIRYDLANLADSKVIIWSEIFEEVAFFRAIPGPGILLL